MFFDDFSATTGKYVLADILNQMKILDELDQKNSELGLVRQDFLVFWTKISEILS